jgi:hypothetical protein
MRKNRIALVNNTVVVAAILGFIELSQRQESIGFGRFGLWCKVPKQLQATVDFPVMIAVKGEKSIMGPFGSPSDTDRMAVSTDVKQNAIISGG